ncbi:MAG TPA: multidrug effflux MFS transporter [Xanthobacteraceae bacterium]|jgi:DHA1 family bicyclomycin/chloramphenicol resistance-like MFS transporter|nr:multidrug effflux MFS transporter [Xanthobacteraceae bacterium]
MLRPDTLALTALLALLTAVGPMSVDLYLPSLPELGRVFGASVPQVQLTLSGYLLCFAIGQIVFGPISDHVGRKPVLLAALSLYVAVCLSCMFATSIEMLIALRCLQALGVAGAPVLARAIVRDLYHGVRAGRELARMGSITALAPVVAPSLGGILQSTFGWRASFLGMAALGLCAIVLVVRLLPETMKQPPKHPMSLLSIIRGYGMFLRHRTFRIYLAIVSASYGGLFAWISGSSFVLQDLYGLSPLLFGLVFAAATLGYGLGTLLAARLVVRIGIDRTIVCGGVALAAGGLAMAAAIALGATSPAALAAPMALYLCGLGLAMPQSMAGALMPFPERAGAASSLLGFLQQATASAVGIVVGQMLGSSALPLAAIIAAMGVLALALALFRRSMGPVH